TSIAASLIATHPRRKEVAMPVIRVLSGLAFGAVALALFAVAAGAANDAPWVGPVVAVVLIVGPAIALAAGILAVGVPVGSRLPVPAVRLGVVALAASAVLGVLALPLALRVGGEIWLAIDAALLLGAVAFVVLGVADLRRTDVRSSTVRGWMAVGAASLVVLAVILVLD
ncbi:MAG TPA: hypothetical protein VF119_06155, partial [Candidatus Limnocylindrales bacterium]